MPLRTMSKPNNMRRQAWDADGRDNKTEESSSEVVLDNFKDLKVSEFLDSDIDAEQSVEESHNSQDSFSTSSFSPPPQFSLSLFSLDPTVPSTSLLSSQPIASFRLIKPLRSSRHKTALKSILKKDTSPNPLATSVKFAPSPKSKRVGFSNTAMVITSSMKKRKFEDDEQNERDSVSEREERGRNKSVKRIRIGKS